MRCKNVHIIYFSPTHCSAKIAHAIAEGLGDVSFFESDITYEMPDREELIEEELCVVAVPVYGGRVPKVAAQRLARFKGNHAPVIPVVIYGNRDYEDALRELCDLLSGQGFTPFAAGAFIGEHSFSRPDLPIAEGRPDKADHDCAVAFGRKALEKLHLAADIEVLTPPQVKGNFPYKPLMPAQPQAPITALDLCTQCEHCIAICPVKAISVVDGEIYSDPQLCIKCCACVKECPEGARSFDTPFAAILHKNFNKRREPELFF